MFSFLKKSKWSIESQKNLSQQLKDLQKDLKVGIVLLVAKESDPYFEIHFLGALIGLLSFYFLGLGLKNYGLLYPEEILILPVLGFALGSFTFHFLRFKILKNFFPSLMINRSQIRARNFHYFYANKNQKPLFLFYFSENELYLEICASPELSQHLMHPKIVLAKKDLLDCYNPNYPEKSFLDFLKSLEFFFHQFRNLNPKRTPHIYEDNVESLVIDINEYRILRGSKDMN